MTALFPRAARVLAARDFTRLRSDGRRLGGRHFSVQVGTNETGAARLGLAVSKRVSKRAVRRNRIKRIARDSFRHMRMTLPAVDVLLIARSGADAQDNAGLREELADLWKRVAALNVAKGTGTMRA